MMFPNTCTCDIPFNGFGYGQEFETENFSAQKSGKRSKLSKESECIEMLKDYKYEVEFSTDEDTGKQRKMYKCKHTKCEKSFTIIWNLLDHVRMHKGIKPHQCHTCGKRFTQMGNFRKHLRTHEDSDINKRKKHQCSICGRKYTEKYNLKVRSRTT